MIEFIHTQEWSMQPLWTTGVGAERRLSRLIWFRNFLWILFLGLGMNIRVLNKAGFPIADSDKFLIQNT